MTAPRSGAKRTLAELSLPSEPGNERLAMEEVAAVVSDLGLSLRSLEKANRTGLRFRAQLAEGLSELKLALM